MTDTTYGRAGRESLSPPLINRLMSATSHKTVTSEESAAGGPQRQEIIRNELSVAHLALKAFFAYVNGSYWILTAAARRQSIAIPFEHSASNFLGHPVKQVCGTHE